MTKALSRLNRTLMVGALIAGLVLWPSCSQPASTQSAVPRIGRVYDRVLASRTIRAGYIPYPPGSLKDPNSGKLSGIHVDALERAAKALDLRVEWVEVSGWGTIVEDVKNGRVDMIGSAVWANSSRGKFAAFTHPLFWSGICVFVRSSDRRFDSNLKLLNSATAKLATIDGEMSDIIAQSDFPAAVRISSPQSSDNSVLLEAVVSGRADAAFVEPYIAQLFMRNRQDSLRNLTPSAPLRIFPNSMMVPIDDPAFLSMLNTAIDELANSGVVDKLVTAYVPEPGAFFLSARPFSARDR